MSTNAALSQRFEQMARLLELLGEDKFRVNAHARAARTIDALTVDVASIAHDRAALLALEGVGPKVADKIAEFVSTGAIAEHKELLAKVPTGLLQVLEIPGVGPKTAKALWDTLGVTSLDDLERVIADGSILTVPRMGEKSVEKIRGSIAIAREGASRLPMGQAMPVAERVVAAMRRVKGVQRAAYAGSLRRGKDTVGDIDVLVTTTDPGAASKAFIAMAGVRQVLASGEGRASVRMAVRVIDATDANPGTTAEGDATIDASPEPQASPERTSERTIQVDLKVVPDASWGAALMYFTGSKDHNVRLRERALKKGLTLNEFGLFPNDDHPEPPHKRGITPVAAATEGEIYAALGLHEIAPELREEHGEFAAGETSAKGAGLPRLIEVDHIKAELHSHTTASDGVLLIKDLAERARARGFHTLAVTDHSKSSVIANGLSVERLRDHAGEIKRVAKGLKGLTLLAGSEVDILADGTLDYDDEALALLDVVVASPHAALTQDPGTATKRLLRAIEHPRVNILGHPTGRLIGKRNGLEPDMAALIAAAKRCNVALEINAHWLRLDLRDTHVHAAVKAGCLIAIDCDVHHPDDFENLRFGVLTGRRGWLTPEQCVNTWPADKLHAWLRSKR